MNGWIKLHRQIMENDIYFEERFTRAQAWVDLLLLAAHTEREISIRNVTIYLKPGELAYSQRTLAERWRWHRNTVANFIKELEKRGMIYHRKTNITTVISIINWNIYQGGVPQEEQSVPQKGGEMYHRDVPQENGDYNSNGKNNGIAGGEGVPQKSTKNEKPLCTNKNVKQEIINTLARSVVSDSVRDRNLYPVVNKFKKKTGDEEMKRILAGIIARDVKFESASDLAGYLQGCVNRKNGHDKKTKLGRLDGKVIDEDERQRKIERAKAFQRQKY